MGKFIHFLVGILCFPLSIFIILFGSRPFGYLVLVFSFFMMIKGMMSKH